MSLCLVFKLVQYENHETDFTMTVKILIYGKLVTFYWAIIPPVDKMLMLWHFHIHCFLWASCSCRQECIYYVNHYKLVTSKTKIQ